MNTAQIALTPKAAQMLILWPGPCLPYPTHVRARTAKPTHRSNVGLLWPPFAASATGPNAIISFLVLYSNHHAVMPRAMSDSRKTALSATSAVQKISSFGLGSPVRWPCRSQLPPTAFRRTGGPGLCNLVSSVRSRE